MSRARWLRLAFGVVLILSAPPRSVFGAQEPPAEQPSSPAQPSSTRPSSAQAAAVTPEAAATAADALTPAERRGKRIYLEGIGTGEVVARVGDEGFEVAASALPCGSCHGADGRGRPEGGVSPTDLTWESLARPYGVTHPSGRRHPSYTEELLARAIADGVDPAGTPLNSAMPRYRMAPADLADLVAYLRRLGSDLDPGVEDHRLVLGSLLPPPGELPAVAAAIRDTLGSVARRVNDRGGVYGRRLEPVFLELPADPAARAAAVAGFLDREGVFALAPSYLGGGDGELLALAAGRGVPVVAPLGVEPRETFPLDRTVFYLLSGVAGQARAAAVAAAWSRPMPTLRPGCTLVPR